MKTVPKTVLGRMLDAGSAANADQLDEMSHDGSLFTDTSAIETKSLDATGGWDSYDVWRRFIKEARDHRKGRIDPS